MECATLLRNSMAKQPLQRKIKPRPPIVHIASIMREANTGLHRNQMITILRRKQDGAVPSCGKTQSLHCFPSDPNIRKEWMNFSFNEVPDRVSKNLVLCSLHVTMDLFTNKAQFDVQFSQRLKLKDHAVLTLLDSTVMAHYTSVSNCFHYLVTIALSEVI